MNPLLDGLRSLGPSRLLALAIVSVVTLVLVGLLAVYSPSEPMALLYGDLDLRDSGLITEALDKMQIPHELRAGGSQIMVPGDKVARARVALARDSLPSGGSIGNEIFDRGDGFTATQFQQRINELRALEGELGRTIRAMNGIRAARVHIALPQHEPFDREHAAPQASILLTMAGGGRLDREAVQAIVSLVATAVPGLKGQNITVADSHGNLLARVGETGAGQARDTAEELRQGLEARLTRTVEELLERTIGPGHVRAETSIELDLDRVTESHEQFDPDGQVVRSTQTSNGSNHSNEATPTVSVQNNLPNADAGSAATSTQEQKQEETTNYEISKTVKTTVRDQAQIRRLSLAVLVDGTEARMPDGTTAWQPRSADELERISRLVKTAVGFDTKRGDQIEVVNLRFTPEDRPAEAEGALLFGLPLQRGDLMALARTLIIGTIATLVLLVVLRPTVSRLTAMVPVGMAPVGAALGGHAMAGGLGDALLHADPGSSGSGDRGGAALGGGGPHALLTGPNGVDQDMGQDEQVELARIGGSVRASSLRRLSALVERHPEETLTIVRSWLQQESV